MRSRLTEYNNRAKQMRYTAEKVKPTEDDQHYHLVGHMVQYEEKVAKKPLVKKNTDTAQKSSKVSKFFDTGSEDSDNDDNKQQPVHKVKPTGSAKEKAPNSSEFFDRSRKTQRTQTLMKIS